MTNMNRNKNIYIIYHENIHGLTTLIPAWAFMMPFSQAAIEHKHWESIKCSVEYDRYNILNRM